MKRLGDRLRLWLDEIEGYPDRPRRVRNTRVGAAMVLASAIAATLPAGNASTSKLAGLGASLGLALMVTAWQSPRAMGQEDIRLRDERMGGFGKVLGVLCVLGGLAFVGILILAFLGLGGCCR